MPLKTSPVVPYVFERIGNAFLVAIDGPVTPPIVYTIAEASRNLVSELDAEGVYWGSIFRLDRDAGFFSDALKLYIELNEAHGWKNRVCVALVALPELPCSLQTMKRIKAEYEMKTANAVEIFADVASAFQWVRSFDTSLDKGYN